MLKAVGLGLHLVDPSNGAAQVARTKAEAAGIAVLFAAHRIDREKGMKTVEASHLAFGGAEHFSPEEDIDEAQAPGVFIAVFKASVDHEDVTGGDGVRVGTGPVCAFTCENENDLHKVVVVGGCGCLGGLP